MLQMVVKMQLKASFCQKNMVGNHYFLVENYFFFFEKGSKCLNVKKTRAAEKFVCRQRRQRRHLKPHRRESDDKIPSADQDRSLFHFIFFSSSKNTKKARPFF